MFSEVVCASRVVYGNGNGKRRIVFVGIENYLFGLFWILKISFCKHHFYGTGRTDIEVLSSEN